MSEEEKVVEEEPKHETVTEEIKVQAEDLFRTINDIIREGTAKRVVVMRNDRILVDIPLVAGMAASLVLAIYMPVLSAIVAVGALFGGCTVRIERDAPSETE
jgi:hypothetical protein